MSIKDDCVSIIAAKLEKRIEKLEKKLEEKEK